MVKTVNLTGDEVEVTDLGGQNTVVKNLGGSAIYASPYPNVTEGADNVVEIPAGGGELVFDTNGTIFLKGSGKTELGAVAPKRGTDAAQQRATGGKVQLTGTSYTTVNFKQPSSSGDGDGYCGATALSGGITSDEGYCENIEFQGG